MHHRPAGARDDGRQIAGVEPLRGAADQQPSGGEWPEIGHGARPSASPNAPQAEPESTTGRSLEGEGDSGTGFAVIHGRPRNSGVIHVRQGFHRPFLDARRPAAGVEGGLSVAGDPARRSLRDAGRGGGLRRDRALGPAQARVPAPAVALRAGHRLARHVERRDDALPADLFAECFTAWVEGLRERAPDIVAIDGKTSRRARAKGSDPLHLVSAWASRQRLVLGQEAVAEKSNEEHPNDVSIMFSWRRRQINTKDRYRHLRSDPIVRFDQGCAGEVTASPARLPGQSNPGVERRA